MEYGGITPVGLPAGWPVLVDDAVPRQPWVVVGSGIRGSKLALPGDRSLTCRLPQERAAPLELAEQTGSAHQVDDRGHDPTATITTR